MSGSFEKLRSSTKMDLTLAVKALEHSWAKVSLLDLPARNTSDLDAYEIWEVLSSRFARLTDIFLSKYLRLEVLALDPGFRGEIRDYIDKAEKLGWISDAGTWMKIRELRNKITHEYSGDDIYNTLTLIHRFAPFVLDELRALIK